MTSLYLRDAIVGFACDCGAIGQQIAIVFLPELSGVNAHTMLLAACLVEGDRVLAIRRNQVVFLREG